MSFIARTFRTLPTVVGALLLLAIAHGPAQADSSKAWILESQSGQVHLVRSGIAPVSLTDGDVFSGGDWIETGPDGRAVLRRGDETIVVAPDSRIGLPKENTGPFATRILQSLGTILLTVEKQAKQHFEVQTPYLTAVVKGTTFTVGIQGERAVVHVVEGLVEVQNLASGRSSLVRPGQTGSVLRNGPAEVEVQGAANGGQTPATQTPGASVPSATQAAVHADDVSRSNGAIVITETLGNKPLDLKGSTRGLIRAAAEAAPQAQLGQGSSKKGQTTLIDAGSNSVAKSNGLAVGQGVSANPGLGNSNGLALGQSTSVAAVSGNGNGLALGQSASAGVSAGNGLAVGQGLSVNPGVSNGIGSGVGNGLGQVATNVPVLDTDTGNGLGVGQGLNPNPGNGNGNGNGKANGQEK